MVKDYDALVAALGPLVIEWLVSNSTAAGEIEAVQSLDNIKALAAYRRIGGTEKTVEVPLNLLTRPIDDIVAICERAAAGAIDAAAQADFATAEAIEAAGAANLAAKLANEALATILALRDEFRDAIDRLNDLSDHPAKIVEGYWWLWNEERGEYENSGERADGNTLFATFEIDPDTGELSVTTPDRYDGPQFAIDDEGNLTVEI
jgi:hypothetical protein